VVVVLVLVLVLVSVVVVLSWPGGVVRCRWSSIAVSVAGICADCISSAALSPPPPQADKVANRSRPVSLLRQLFLIVSFWKSGVLMYFGPFDGGGC